MIFYDLNDTGTALSGPFTPANAKAIGTFDAAHGYGGAVIDFGNPSIFVNDAGGLTAAINYLVECGNNYLAGNPNGTVAISFNNDGVTSSNASSYGQLAAELQNGFGSGVTGSVGSPYFDAESGYDPSFTPTLDMVTAYFNQSEWGLNSDLAANTDWTCSQTSSLISAIGGADYCMPQFYCSGQPPYYTNCNLSGLGGVTIYDAASVCPGQNLGYQGGITAFKNAFGVCPTTVLVDGGYGNTISASSLTCS